MRIRKPISSARRILVVGSGPTGLATDGSHHVDLTCGHFLRDLAAAGFEVSFMQPLEPVTLMINYYGCVLPAAEVRSIGLDRRTPTGAVRTGLAAIRALMRADFVYLFFPGRLPSLLGALCRALGKPYGVYLRGERYSKVGADRLLLERAQFILAASPGLAAPARKINPNIELFRPMVELSAADAVRSDCYARAPGPLRLLFVGRIEADKGVPELVDAAEALRRRGFDFELKLVGWGDLHAELTRRFPADNASGVLVLGGLEDRRALMRLYEETDLFVFPTHHEGFPRVLYEAMLKSAVVVTTMVGGIPALLRDNENCVAVPVGDSVAIANAIERLASDPALMQRLADSALATALEALEGSPTQSEVLQRKLGNASSANDLGIGQRSFGAFRS